MMSVSHGVEFASRMNRGERSPIMSTSTSAFSVDKRAVLARGVDVVLAAVGVIGPAPVPERRFFAVEEDQLDREGVGARLQHARELDEERRARPAVVCADEAKVAKQLRVVVPGDGDPLLARARDGGDEVDHRDVADGRLRDECLLVTGMPSALSCSMMYSRVRAMPGEPAGRGPKPTICRRCSYARE